MGSSTAGPVQARSVATRAALLEAAIECLCADGYAATTTTEIARRAGVSRGGQLHHFPTKAELVAAALEHLLERRLREFRELFVAGAADLDGLDSVVDRLWVIFEGQAFVAWVELWMAARTDPGLATIIVDFDRRFTDDTTVAAAEIVSRLGSYDQWTLELVRDFVFALMTGLALQRLVPRGQRPVADYLGVLKRVVAEMLSDNNLFGGR